MKTWHVAVMATAITAVAVTAGFAMGRRATDPAPRAPLAPANVPAQAAADPAGATPAPADGLLPDPAPEKATPAPKPAKPGKSSLPADLAKALKLTQSQGDAVDQALKSWKERFDELNTRIKETLAKSTDPAARKAAVDQWSMEFDRLKAERTAALLASMTPEQQAAYREFRDKQYGSWLDGKVSGLSVMAKHALKVTDQQVEQMKPIFRETVDGVTAGGTMTPNSAQVEGAQQALIARVQGLLTPEQAQAMERFKQTFRIY